MLEILKWINRGEIATTVNRSSIRNVEKKAIRLLFKE